MARKRARVRFNLTREFAMNTQNKLTITHSKSIGICLLSGAGLFIILPLAFTIFQGVQHPLLYVLCLMLASLFIWIDLRFMAYKITVKGTTISVCKGLFKKFSLDVSEIESIKWITAVTKFGQNENITVQTKYGKFKVETLMVGSAKMIDFLRANVDESKIQTKAKNFAS
jgi:hypothetical protein